MNNKNSLLETAAKLLNAAVSNDMAEQTDSSGKQEKSEYITKEAAKAIAKVSIWTISRWLKLKDKNDNYLIHWIKLGTAQSSPVRIDKASFMAYLESKTVHPQEEVKS